MIVGAQKGGSTRLAWTLAEHPDIWIPRSESPEFRDPIFSEGSLQSLRTQIAGAPPASTRGIKCPDYLGRPEVPQRLADYCSLPKIVACLREPISRAVSAYYWHVRWGLLPLEDVNDGLAAIMAGKYKDIDPRVNEVLEWGRYGCLLKRYTDIFGRGRVHVLFDEDLRRSMATSLPALFDFLGVAPHMPRRETETTVNEGIYAPWRLRFVRLRNRYVQAWDRQNGYVTIRKPVERLPRMLSNLVAGVDRALFAKLSRNAKPELSSKTMSALADYYSDDARLLESLLGRKPPWRLGMRSN